MSRFRLDDREIEFAPGETILDAARRSGVEIPTLCLAPGRDPQTSCFVCVVKVEGMPRPVPSCATLAAEGMVVANETDEVRDARRTALELLLGDHLGDCLGPCQGVCPAHMDMPRMIRLIAEGRDREALAVVREAIPLPATLGRICPELCEKGCRRAASDHPVAICKLKRYVADRDLESGDPLLPDMRASSGKRVAIVGSGPAGLSAAYYLRAYGHGVTLFDNRDEPGGMLRYGVSPELLPRETLDAEIGIIRKMGAEFRCGVRIGDDIALDTLRSDYDAVLLATGPVTENPPPEGLAAGPKGLKPRGSSMQSSLPGVFVAGSVIQPSRHAVRAVADGRTAADAIHHSLSGDEAGEGKPFSVHVGRLDAEEVIPYAARSNPEDRVEPSGGFERGYTEEEARREAERCLRCDCGAAVGCGLRRYAAEYGANPLRYRGERRPYERDDSHPDVAFEPGKCIACGICVQVAADAGEELGLTFTGRGFTVRMAAPFGEPLAKGLERAAAECARLCPTGALICKKHDS